METSGTPDLPAEERVVVVVDADLEELVDEYLDNRRADARAIPELLAAGNYDDLWSRGHNMKGVGAAYGFDFLTELGADLEGASRRRDDAGVRRCATALDDYLRRLDVRFETQ